MNQKLESLLQLALQTSEETRERTEDLNVGFDRETRTWELIVKYHGNLDELRERKIEVEYLIAGYALLTVPEGLVETVAELEQIEYVEKPRNFYYEAADPIEDSCILQLSQWDLSLTGKGVLIAIPDSGIDYRRPEFRRADGSTRIRFLWDQTLEPSGQTPGGGGGNGQNGAGTGPVRQPPAGFRQGVEFNAAQIDAALQAGTREQQFLLLPSADTGGHGTAVAGIAAGFREGEGGGDGFYDGTQYYRGVAPEAELLIVKLGLPEARSFPRTTEIMRAVAWSLRKAQELQMPLVINLSFGNSYGAHDGSSLLERFLDNA